METGVSPDTHGLPTIMSGSGTASVTRAGERSVAATARHPSRFGTDSTEAAAGRPGSVGRDGQLVFGEADRELLAGLDLGRGSHDARGGLLDHRVPAAKGPAGGYRQH